MGRRTALRHKRPFQNRSLCERSDEPSNLTPDRIVELLDVIGRICASLASGAIRFPLNASAFSKKKRSNAALPPTLLDRLMLRTRSLSAISR
jgi:hypothetical protein